MKDYLVLSHEGNVKILDIPNNIKKSEIIEVARRVICDTIKPVTHLNNVKTYKNYEIDIVEKEFFEFSPPEDYIMIAFYEDYK